MKQKAFKNILNYLFLSLVLVGAFFSSLVEVKAQFRICEVGIDFNPEFSNNVVLLKGTVTWKNADKGVCYGPGNNNPADHFTISYSIDNHEIVNQNGNRTSVLTTRVPLQKGNTNPIPFAAQINPYERGFKDGDTLKLKAYVWTYDSPSGSPLAYSSETPVVIGQNTNAPVALFGCRASNDVWTCSEDQNDAGLKACVTIVKGVSPPEKCGCTDASYAKGCRNGVTPPANTNPVDPNKPSTQPASTGNTSAPPCPDDPKNPAYYNCHIYNPIPLDSLSGVLLLIMRAFSLGIALFAVAFIVIGGFKYVISQGNEEAVASARKTITYAVIGLVIASLAFAIIAIIQNVLKTDIKDIPATKQNTMDININKRV